MAKSWFPKIIKAVDAFWEKHQHEGDDELALRTIELAKKLTEKRNQIRLSLGRKPLGMPFVCKACKERGVWYPHLIEPSAVVSVLLHRKKMDERRAGRLYYHIRKQRKSTYPPRQCGMSITDQHLTHLQAVEMAEDEARRPEKRS
jgi:hypothetical protein